MALLPMQAHKQDTLRPYELSIRWMGLCGNTLVDCYGSQLHNIEVDGGVLDNESDDSSDSELASWGDGFGYWHKRMNEGLEMRYVDGEEA